MNRGYLLDTSVLSLLAPGRRDATPEFLTWVAGQDRSLFISSVCVFEVEQGIARLARGGGIVRAAETAAWLERVLAGFGPNALAVDMTIARAAGQISDRALAVGRHPGVPDILIAATAEVRGLLLLTRNLRHFQPLGIAAHDPVTALPD